MFMKKGKKICQCYFAKNYYRHSGICKHDSLYFVSQILPEIIQSDIDELLSVDAYFLILTLIHQEYHRIFDHVTATLHTCIHARILQHG